MIENIGIAAVLIFFSDPQMRRIKIPSSFSPTPAEALYITLIDILL